ncbi:hypothetical protein EVAR_86387_1 [Eumeta japonica]|uniref:Uncharacterized protein n=1 Tax=Eumeta variegata TaxID=151549 RepID=A0A4C1WAC4_EUMVA|nr:hypothetical protein EVAR_86387_1 [Eumeta japonica]
MFAGIYRHPPAGARGRETDAGCKFWKCFVSMNYFGRGRGAISRTYRRRRPAALNKHGGVVRTETYLIGVFGTNTGKKKFGCLAARGRPIIVEWERDARHSAGLSRSVTHRYVTERYTFQSDSQPQPNLRRCHVKEVPTRWPRR